MSKHLGLTEWLTNGERGMSSNTIARHLSGRMARDSRWDDSIPYDPADFRRCELLLRAVPSLRPLMPKMATLDPVWGLLVDRWDEIADAMEREVPNCFDHGADGNAHEAYRIIRECRKGES